MFEEYLKKRNEFIEENKKLKFDYQTKLNEKEMKVNEILKKIFEKEKSNPKTSATLNFYERFRSTAESKSFQILKKFPKGALLHAHYLAMINVNKFIQSSTYHPNVKYFG